MTKAILALALLLTGCATVPLPTIIIAAQTALATAQAKIAELSA